MMNKILASNDVTDYRGYLITDFGDYVEVVDCADDSLFGIYDSVAEAEREIDDVLDMDEDAEVLAIEHMIRYNEYHLQDFARWRDIEIDHWGNVLSDTMSHPRDPYKRIKINFDNLSSMVKSFNRLNGTTYRVKDTADGFKISCL